MGLMALPGAAIPVSVGGQSDSAAVQHLPDFALQGVGGKRFVDLSGARHSHIVVPYRRLRVTRNIQNFQVRP